MSDNCEADKVFWLISRCLFGEPVCFGGGYKGKAYILQTRDKYFEFKSFNPELDKKKLDSVIILFAEYAFTPIVKINQTVSNHTGFTICIISTPLLRASNLKT